MPEFSPEAVAQLLADCRRHCCVCLRWCGQRMQIHHIEPKASGGSGDYDNGIPVCLDCHAEIESRSNMGRKFTLTELKEHRDRWFTIVRDRPEVLIRSASTQTATGPLEALLAELDFNGVSLAITADEFPFLLARAQFDRAIATNALAALPQETREELMRTYALIARINSRLTIGFERAARGDVGKAADWSQPGARRQLAELIPKVMGLLRASLGLTDL